ncbi:MAG: histidine--tRNA ligase [Armatimonadetes bacterium]|nr:histidine--tRNA ligase [Armatimonadota bacterium]
MNFQSPRGTHDILPADSRKWQELEQKFRGVAELFGFEEIRTPIFEDTNLFTRTSGETSDVVSKEMYTFRDRGDRSITLKPEGTAPVVRAYLQHHLGQQGQVTRLWYLTPFFRYDRPQKGRFRQAHQFGLELIGASSPLADAEVIQITSRFYQEIGLGDTVVLLNSIGREETRTKFRAALLAHMDSYLKDLSEEDRAKSLKNPLRLIDSKDPKAQSLVAEGPSIQDYLEDTSRAHFDRLQQILTDAGVAFKIAPHVVRGLDYYTDTVFEIHSASLGAQGALCGGGRYDNLIKEVGGPAIPSVGVGIGVERALLVLEEQGYAGPVAGISVYVASATPDAAGAVVNTVAGLRSAGVDCLYAYEGGSLKSQLKEADRVNARFAVLIGTDEMAANSATVRDLKTGEQALVSLEGLSTHILGVK